jgi:hypothetical protein
MGWATFWAIFFTNSFGHPGCAANKFLITFYKLGSAAQQMLALVSVCLLLLL